jgi:hypothetical protein
MLIVRDPFANKRAVEQRLVSSLVVEEITSAVASVEPQDRVAINDVISFLHIGRSLGGPTIS